MSESTKDPNFKKPKKKKPATKKGGLGRKMLPDLEKVAKRAKSINKPNKVVKKNPGGKKIVGKKGKVGVKRKGRLPSKKIINKLGNVQTVYYRPDNKTKSKYIDPTKLKTGEMMLDYGDSFKRMLFRDHDSNGRQGWVRKKGEQNQAWGHEMTAKLDKLVDDYGFSLDKFDQQQESKIKDRDGSVDKFMEDAKEIYNDLYTINEQKPITFVNRIFEPAGDRIGHNTAKKDREYMSMVANGLGKAVKRVQQDRVNAKAIKDGADKAKQAVKDGAAPKRNRDNVNDNKRRVAKKLKGVKTIAAQRLANDNKAVKKQPKTNSGGGTINQTNDTPQSEYIPNQKVAKLARNFRKK